MCFLFGKSYSQQIILAEKDSAGNMKYKELTFFKAGASDGFQPFSIRVFLNTIVTFEHSWVRDGVKKCFYKIVDGELIKIKEFTGKYVPPVNQKGYYQFQDSTTVNY